ncbi:lipoyl synthase [Corynebacterium sp. CMW7794]|uniref:lipoyl synthase n=1 Tax=Corynebacterium TaxID=1716 RepID=UPI000794E539|nr:MULTISPECIES: lipoyl synthase [Corynebacterium]KXB55254.1 lipoyl synthase [Corynebacterium sp. DNF00584]KXI18781.1 lipoyl synthase [Corynebacterium sp. CMW7794]MBF9010791.1 lipoyl synthase [Corynebacterium phoceense]MCQ9330532.1 lipoyl synthase [Corynebacterium phoceense]MCQ9341433.1 lipoyl synthase [Corynebacterium phoceense]
MSVKHEGRRLLRIEAKNSETPIEQKPRWIRNQVRTGPGYEDIKNKVKGASLHTVCQEAGCPNIHECWESREATFLIGGDSCTRRCDFCDIKSGKPEPLDREEPLRVAEEVRNMQLNYSTITGVTRDDLPDEGAWLYAEVVRKIHELNPNTGVENLTPDFSGKPDLLEEVFSAQPEVFAHNVETVPRIFKRIRPAFRYERSLDVIRQARDFGLITKSNLILGMGETPEEIQEALRDLHSAGCDIITITQYLRPGPRYHPIERWVRPEEFVEHAEYAKELGFGGVMSGPLVRSSYRAGRLYVQAMEARGRELPPHLAHLAETSEGATAQEASTLLEKYGPSVETPVTTRMVKTPAKPETVSATIR